MTGKTHQVIGLTTGLAAYLYLVPASYNPATLAWVCVASSLGALLPDIDTPAARIWQALPFGRVAGEMVSPFLQHRNLTHSLLGFGLVAWVSLILFHHVPSYWGVDTLRVWLAGLVAYASHLLADALTVEGIPLLFPYQHSFGIPPRPFEGLRIETGRWFENLVVFPLVNLFLIGLIYLNWGTIRLILFH